MCRVRGVVQPPRYVLCETRIHERRVVDVLWLFRSPHQSRGRIDRSSLRPETLTSDKLVPAFIHFITTGGTIDKIYHDARSNYEVGDPQVIELLREALVTFDYEVTQVFRKDSLDLTEDDRDAILAAVKSTDCDRIVVTHGTDTMTKTAAVLKAVTDKVIVLTGSLAPARFKTSDAEFNLGMAIAAAQSLEPGVYITMNGRVFEADKVRKNPDKNEFEVLSTEY